MNKLILPLIANLSLATTPVTTDTIVENNIVDIDTTNITYWSVGYAGKYFVDKDQKNHQITLINDENVEIKYDKGLVFHGYAVFRFDFDFDIVGFKSDFGLNDCDRKASGTEFKIKIIANNKYIYESEIITQSNHFGQLNLELEPTNNFIIELDTLGSNQNDNVTFGNPQVIKKELN